ncbi:MAG TPA: glycosyltransferase family 39 protein [Solirubrobacteraceae bacterium]
MATTVARPRHTVPTVDVSTPRWFERIPIWASTGGFLLLLMLASTFMRTRYLSGQFWMDEAITTGIASHSLSAIPGILRHDGNPPLYYMMLHVWIQIFGASESATHALSLVFGLLTIPVSMWAGWSLFGRRAGMMAAVLFAFSAFLTQYAQETRMYELMGLLGLFATAGFVHAFVYRRRKYLIMFSVALALMLYTQSWGVFFWGGAVLALIPTFLRSDDRRGLLRDAAIAFIGAGILYLPWLPNFLYQAKHTAAPWDSSPHFGAPVQLSRNLLGGDRVSIALLLATTIGVAELFTRAHRRTRDATVMWTLIAIPAATLALAWIASQITPAWVPRYFAPVLAGILLLAAFGCSRAGVVGIVAVVFSVIFLINPSSYTPAYKSDVRSISGEMTPHLRAGDLVISAQPEQIPLTWYYLPPNLRYASSIGPVKDPSYMDWIDALKRLQNANPQATLAPLLASLKPGQQILYVRPLTEGASNWKAPWTQLVRRRAAQWGALLAANPHLREIAVAPHNYRGACCVADSAVLYQKTS